MRRLAGSTTSGVLRIRRREEIYRDLLTRFFVLLKAAQTSDSSDPQWIDSLDEFYAQLVEVLAREGTLFLSERDGYLYVNAIRARIDADGFATQRFLVRELVQCGLGGVIFERGIERDEVARFLDVFFHAGTRTKTSAHEIDVRLRQSDIKRVHVLARQEPVADEESSKRELASSPIHGETYFKDILVFRHLLRALDPECPIRRDEAQQIVQVMVHRLLVCEDGQIALDLVRDVDGDILNHAVSVAVPAVAIARRYGMSEALACEFGIATLLAGVLRSVDCSELAADPLERQQVLHLVANGGASGIMLLSALYGWDEQEAVDGDPSIATAVLRVARRWLDERTTGASLREILERLVDGGYDEEVVMALQLLCRQEQQWPSLITESTASSPDSIVHRAIVEDATLLDAGH